MLLLNAAFRKGNTYAICSHCYKASTGTRRIINMNKKQDLNGLILLCTQHNTYMSVDKLKYVIQMKTF